MEKVKILLATLLLSLGVNAQNGCGCPELMVEYTTPTNLRFKSECQIVVTNDLTLSMDLAMGSNYWNVGGLFYFNVVAYGNDTFNLNSLEIEFNSEICTYNFGELGVPNFNLIREDLEFRVYSLEGKYIGTMNKRAILTELPFAIYILRNQEKRLTFKIKTHEQRI